MPDFEPFFELTDHKGLSHSWSGLFWFDLPLAIFCTYVFQFWIKNALIQAAPFYWRSRWVQFYRHKPLVFSASSVFRVCYSALAGCMLHLLWDALTHLDLIHPHGMDTLAYLRVYPRYTIWLQIVSSVVGIVACYVYMSRLPSSSCETAAVSARYRKGFWSIFCCSALVFLGYAFTREKFGFSLVGLTNFLLGGCALGLLVAPLAFFVQVSKH